MTEREITSIVWHQPGDQVDLIYGEGEPDHLVGSQSVAAELARSVGLVSVPTPPGTDPQGRTCAAPSELRERIRPLCSRPRPVRRPEECT